MTGLTIVISGPSGVGKGTICKKVCEYMPQLEVSVSVTTRMPRPGEEEGRSYFFISKDDFRHKIEEGYFLEWARFYDQYYGTPRDVIERVTSRGKDVLLELDVQGAMQVKDNVPGAVFIFIAPPSTGELKRRITTRGTEKPEHILRRLEIAQQELNLYKEYDYLVINNEIEEAALKISSIITAEKCRVIRYPDLWQV